MICYTALLIYRLLEKQLKDKERRIFMYTQITNAKQAIKQINKVYPILEKLPLNQIGRKY